MHAPLRELTISLYSKCPYRRKRQINEIWRLISPTLPLDHPGLNLFGNMQCTAYAGRWTKNPDIGYDLRALCGYGRAARTVGMVQWWATQVAVSGDIQESIWRML